MEVIENKLQAKYVSANSKSQLKLMDISCQSALFSFIQLHLWNYRFLPLPLSELRLVRYLYLHTQENGFTWCI